MNHFAVSLFIFMGNFTQRDSQSTFQPERRSHEF